jgi:hypothetical protein
MSSTRFQFPFPDLNQIPTRNPHSVTKTKQPQIIDNQETNPKVRIFDHFKDPNKTNFTNPNSTISLTNINQATPFANKTRSTKQQGQNKNLQVSHRIYQESIHSKSKQLDTKKGISEKGNVVNKIRYLIEKERKEKRRSEGGEWELVAVKEPEKERERRGMTL